MRRPPSRPSRLGAQLALALLATVLGLAAPIEYSAAQRPADETARPGDRAGQGKPRRRPERPAPAAEAPPEAPAPGTGGATGKDRNNRLGKDPFSTMGGTSPFCRKAGLAARERANCRGSGALSHPQEISHYGFDVHIDTGVDNIGGNISAGLQGLGQLLWMGLLWAIKGVTLLLEWAFSLDVLSAAMSAIKQALVRLHRDVFGQAWFLAAISATGLWAIYRGFVQRRTIQTITGLAATVALMLVALVIINNPVGTVGYASKLANDASLGIVSGATTGTVTGSPKGFGQAMTRTFDQGVLRPWCALEFSDVEFCLSRPTKVIHRPAVPGNESIEKAWAQSSSVAEMFLGFEPNGKDGVGQRDELYEDWKDNDGTRLQGVMRIQKEASTGPRLAMLFLIAVGLTGMILTLGWIGLRLLGYGVMALLLILLTPVMLLAPALGDPGRATFLGWGKRLFGALVAKMVYALFLAVVLVAAAALAELDSLGWIAQWITLCVFWWTVFLKRNDVIQFASIPGGQEQRAPLLQRLYYGQQGIRSARAGGQAVGGFIGRRKANATLGAVALGGAAKNAAAGGKNRAAATRQLADERLRERAGDTLGRQNQEARALLERDREAGDRLKRVNGLLRPYDERAERARANGTNTPEATEAEAALLRSRQDLQGSRPAPGAVAAAREHVRHAATNQARTGAEVSSRDEAAYITKRRQELATLPLEHASNLRAAGVDPQAYREASPSQQRKLHAQVKQAIGQEEAQLAAAPAAGADPKGPAPPAPRPREIRVARKGLDPGRLVAVRSAEIKAARAARRAERSRHRVEQATHKLGRRRR